MKLTENVQHVLSVIKEGGATGIAVMLVAFYLGQAAGWVPDVNRQDHIAIAETLHDGTEQVKEQTRILKYNQGLMEKQVKIAKSLCYNAPTKELVRECLLKQEQ